MDNKTRQKAYRERALKDPDGLLLTRLQVLIGPSCNADLGRVIQAKGWTKREAVERAIKMLAQAVTV